MSSNPVIQSVISANETCRYLSLQFPEIRIFLICRNTAQTELIYQLLKTSSVLPLNICVNFLCVLSAKAGNKHFTKLIHVMDCRYLLRT